MNVSFRFLKIDLMDENFQKLSHSSDTGAFENSDNIYSPSIFSSMDEIKINQSEFQSFFHDDFSFSRVSSMPRWKSDMENSNSPSNFSNQLMSSRENFVIDDYFGKKNKPSSSITDSIVSPMSRLSTSSSLMSFHSLNNYKSTEQLASRSTLMSSTDQLVVPNENINLLPTSSFLPLPMPSTNRPVLSTIDNTASSFIDNDLQRVPPSFMIIQPPSSYENTHVVQSAGRSNSMPSWRGYLPIRFESIANDQYQITTHFSQKVFLGGIPSELTEAELLLVLRKFGKCNIKWPKTDTLNSNNNIPSFCHVVFRESRSVSELLKHCIRQQQRSTTEYFLHIHMSPSSSLSIRTNRLKPIQVVPWNMKDNVYVMNQENLSAGETTYKDWSRTIFVSPLHGKMTGFSLGTIMANVFGPVSMAQVNTDKYGYPTGTGTVLFYDSHSYMRAVAAGAIDIKSDCFHKLLDIDPFLRENEPCAFCSSNADLFCRNFHCLRSYCRQCWVNRHGPKPLADHQPATRRHQPF